MSSLPRDPSKWVIWYTDKIVIALLKPIKVYKTTTKDVLTLIATSATGTCVVQSKSNCQLLFMHALNCTLQVHYLLS